MTLPSFPAGRATPVCLSAFAAIVLSVVPTSLAASDCIGFLYPCAAHDETLCRSTYGCEWATTQKVCDNDTAEVPAVCGNFSAAEDCTSRGCTWAPTSTPGTCFSPSIGSLYPCDHFRTNKTCFQRLGCSWSASSGCHDPAGSRNGATCDLYFNQQSCEGMGCSWTNIINFTLPSKPPDCIGTLFPCQAYLEEDVCRDTYGCRWKSNQECDNDGNEKLANCSYFSRNETCVAHGCSWSPFTELGECSGSIFPCDVHLQNVTCLQRLGCEWSRTYNTCGADAYFDAVRNCSVYSAELSCTSDGCVWEPTTISEAPAAPATDALSLAAVTAVAPTAPA